ncbi:MAG: 2-C-methyl-D-erythritol 2,4-cyclodiphosphate synthase [Terrimicrobiaceae bacterium]|jgi:2-C-methyl-D-erythritol 2,4-cyclodiphosphate synthase
MFACGIGYDVHRFLPGRLLVLGGVTIDHPLGLEGHSDADVLCHAIADALLGAAGESDIGHLFPNTEESVRGMSSIVIVRTVRERLSAKGSVVLNVDATLVAEAPKIAPYLNAMKANLAVALAVPADRVGIKATTNEGMGFLGRGEGIAALAVAAVERK